MISSIFGRKIKFQDGEYGKKAIMQGQWSEAIFAKCVKANIQSLELNKGHDWAGSNIDFVAKLPWLKELIILDDDISDLKPVNALKKLKSLELFTGSNTAIDFSNFTELESFSMLWIGGSESIFGCETLKQLCLYKCDLERSDIFSNLHNLEFAKIMNSKFIELKALFRIKPLRDLWLSDLRKLTSIDGISKAQNLESIRFDTCRNIANVSEIFELRNLKSLVLGNCHEIRSLKGIEKLTELHELEFWESTNILDGDLTPILNLKKLRNVAFQNRKHYSHTNKEINAILEN